MAGATSNVYDQSAVVRQDLSGILPIIKKAYTPFLSRVAQGGVATARLVEWVADSITFPSANNANVDGAPVTAAAGTFGSRATNWTQILMQSFAISDTMGETGTNIKLTVANAYMSLKEKKLGQMAIDLEFALINATGNAGASGTASEMKGLAVWGTANTAEIVASAFSASGKVVTTGEGAFKSLLSKLYTNGAQPDFAYMSIENKNLISAWKGHDNTQNIDAKLGEINDYITLYRTDEGIIEFIINTSAMVGSASVYAGRIEGNMDLKWLRKAKIKQLGKPGDSESYIITQEVTLGVENPSSVAVLTLT